MVDAMNTYLGGALPRSEAVALALHLVNAGFSGGDLSATYTMTGIIQQMIAVIEGAYGITLAQDSVNVARFITHLRYCSYASTSMSSSTMSRNQSSNQSKPHIRRLASAQGSLPWW